MLADPRRPANTTRFVYLHPQAAEELFVDYDTIARDAAAMLRYARQTDASAESQIRFNAVKIKELEIAASASRPDPAATLRPWTKTARTSTR